MKNNTFYFKIVTAKNCPLYQLGEIFSLSSRALSCPKNKAACLVLVREMTNILFELLGGDSEADIETKKNYSCSGCLGLIKFNLIAGEQSGPADSISSIPYLAFTDKEQLAAIREHPMINVIPESEIFRVVSCFRKERLSAGSTLISNGQCHSHCYLLLSGEMVVINDSTVIASLESGDICGEMSYFTGGVAGADVKVVSETVVLSIPTDTFSKLLDDIPELQSFMAQTFANRLTQANAGHADAMGAGMRGWLNDMPPADLLQILHMHRKTGTLDFEFPLKRATVFFREGEIVGASYNEKEGRDALCTMLQETEGRYTFTVGLTPEKMEADTIDNFMKLLLGCARQLDEAGEEC